MNFWQTLPTHFVGLSPMDGVTDQPFRHICAKYGQPAVSYTEFTCVEGITHGATRLLRDLLFDETQQPILGQIYGHTPKDFRTVATLVCALGFDGVDINMGCPAKNVTHTGSGAALINTPKLAKNIVKQTKLGVKDWADGKNLTELNLSDDIIKEISPLVKSRKSSREMRPVSIKTRVGFSHPVTDEWITSLLETEPDAIAIHGRTLKQYYGGESNWEEIAKAVEVAKGSGVKIIGNGDIKIYEDATRLMKESGVDGVLIARAAMGNPWIFKNENVDYHTRLTVAVEHAKVYEETFSHEEKYNFLPMRKHLGWYVKGFDGASAIRTQLMQTDSAKEVEDIIKTVR